MQERNTDPYNGINIRTEILSHVKDCLFIGCLLVFRTIQFDIAFFPRYVPLFVPPAFLPFNIFDRKILVRIWQTKQSGEIIKWKWKRGGRRECNWNWEFDIQSVHKSTITFAWQIHIQNRVINICASNFGKPFVNGLVI